MRRITRFPAGKIFYFAISMLAMMVAMPAYSKVVVAKRSVSAIAKIDGTNTKKIGAPLPSFTQPDCVSAPSGLVAWWTGEGNANDSAGTNNGSLSLSGAAYAVGEVGHGFRFDGTNGYVQIPDADALKPTNVTVEAWVWLDPSLPPNAGGEQIVFKKNTWSAWFEGYSLLKTTIDNGNGTYSDRFQFCVSRYGNQVAINSQTIAQRGVWYHVAATYDGNQSILYVNGAAEASATPGFPLDYDTTPVYIGTTGTWPPYLSMFGGILDEVSIYNRALASNEIAAIYTAGSAGKCQQGASGCVTPPSGLVGWWKGDGNTLDSVSGSNGVLVNASYTNGVVGQAFSFDPENYPNTYTGVQIADQPAYALTNSLTIEGWVRPRGDGYFIFFRGDNRPGLDPYGLAMQANDTLLFQITDANGNNVSVQTVLAYNQWTHVAATLDDSSGTMSIYTNGVLAAQTVTTIRPFGALIPGDSPGIGIGNLNDGQNNFPFLGDIDEISLYNRALSAAEIQAIYSAGSAGKCQTSSPPMIVTQPQGQLVFPGAQVTLSATATGAQPINYQWLFDGSNLLEATNATLILTNIQFSQSGNYSLQASNSAGVAVSSNAQVTVNYPVNGLVLWNTLGSDTEISNSVYGPNLQKYTGGSGVDIPANTAYAPGEFGDAVGIAPGSYFSESRVHNLVLNNLPQIINPNQGTIDVWFIQNSTPTPYVDGVIRIFDGAYGLDSGISFHSLPPPDNLQLGLTFGGTTTAVNYDITASNGMWLNLAGVWDIAGIDGSADKLRLYVNGQLVATSTSATWGTTVGDQADIAGGQDSGCAGQFLVDNLKVFNRALSAGEVAQVYGGGEGFTNWPPSIAQQPQSQTNIVGSDVSFSVVASGLPLPNYQWYLNGAALTNDSRHGGVTSSNMTIANLQSGDAGNYSVLVTNIAGSMQSSNAVLTVYVQTTPPMIVAQTPNEVVLLGSAVTFSVTASGGTPLTYIWSRNNAPIPDATNSSYTLFNAQLSASGSKFNCVVTNLYGMAASTNVSLKVIDTISNDLCSGAVLVTAASYTNVQSTLKASAFGDPSPDCVDGFGHGVWYQFTAPVAGLLYVDTFGSDFDTGLAVYTGTCDALTEVACNDDTGGPTSQVILPTAAGMTYFILAGGYGSDAGNLVLHLNHLTPPAFVIGPSSSSVVVSSNAIFAATLSGSLPMTFQWYFNNAPLMDGGRVSGSTNLILTIANVQTNDGGNYFLVASNIVGATTSSVAVLTPIILPPTISTPPVNQSILVGSNATFFVGVDGTPPYNYQWFFNSSPLADDGVHIAGSSTSSLTISNLTTADAGIYSVTVTNVSGSNSASATLTVLVPPAITTPPAGRSVPPGLPTTFSVTVSSIPAPNYQWLFNGTNITGWTTVPSYTIPAVGTNNLGFYSVIASNSVGVATSAVAQLTFGPVAAWGRNISGESLPPPGLSNVVGIAGGNATSFAVKSDGTLVSWGSGNGTNIPASATNVVAVSASGFLGNNALRSDGTVVGWAGSIPPPGLSNVVSIASGSSFSLALRAEGSVVGWGQLYGTMPAGLNHVTAISGGSSHALALRSDGTVVSWGIGTATNVPLGLSNVTAIAAGYTYSLALKANGTVVAWGSGTGTNLPAGLTNIIAISAENTVPNSLSLALRANGTVVAWGDNPNGETNVPPALANLLSVAIAAAPNHGLALVNDGSPQILQPPVGLTTFIGRNVSLQAAAAGAAPLSYQWLLNGTNVPGATNTTLLLPNIQLPNAGGYQLFVSNSINAAISLPAPVNVISNNALILLTQSSGSASNVYQGGKITLYGAAVLGNGPLQYQWFFSPTNRNYTAVSGGTSDTLTLDPALALQSGNYYVAISNPVGGVTSAPVSVKIYFARAWGYNALSNPPVNVTNAIAVATGGASGNSGGLYLALGTDGKVYAWANYFTLYGETNVSALSNSFVTAIAAGNQHALALKSDGTVYAWGNGTFGQTNVPANLNNVIAISCGGYHDLALKSDGTVVPWGDGPQAPIYGQATNNPAATNVVAIAAGTTHSLALRADGTVVAWGYNLDGTSTVPPTASNVVAIAAGGNLSVALRANGTIVQWGGGISQYPIPLNLSNVVAVSAAASHVTALKKDGTVVSWGSAYIGLAASTVPPDVANVAALSSGGDHDFALLGTRAPAFTVQPWNRTVFNTVTSVWFSGKCAGVQPITYQWRLNGTNLLGATNDMLTVNGGRQLQGPGFLPLQPGIYQLIASNSYGVVASKFAKLTVLIPLGVALNATNLSWTTSGSAQWFGETNITHDGVSAAQSGGIGPLQETILQTTVATNAPGRYTFWWKVSSEQDFDFLEFRINGIVQTNISGEVDWQQVSIPVGAGTNVLVWRYSKDATFDDGADAGWVDQFAFLAAPVILTQPAPASQTVNLGASVHYAVGVKPEFTVQYQWWQNSTNPVGGNSSALALNNVARAQNGTYFVTVTSAGGSVTSSVVSLKVLVPQLLGTPQLLPGGTFQLTSTDANGGLLQPSDLPNFEAQASTNLVNWTILPGALSLTNGILRLQDNSTTNWPERYYRILEH